MGNKLIICPKCGYQRNTNDDPQVPPGQCPACGIYYFKYIQQKSGEPKPKATPPSPKTPTESKSINHQQTATPEPTDIEKMLAYQELATHKTSHILHFFLSLITAGFWLLAWLIISANNTGERNKIRRKYNLPIESDSAGNLIKITLLVFIIVIIMRGCYR